MILPIINFSKEPMLKKPVSQNYFNELSEYQKDFSEVKQFYVNPKDFRHNGLNNTYDEIVKQLQEGKYFLASSGTKNGFTGENIKAKYNCFYLDLDEKVRWDIETVRKDIKASIGKEPFSSWYSLSSDVKNKKQKHLMVLDKIFEGEDQLEEFKKIVGEIVSHLPEKYKITEDTSAYSPARVCFSKHPKKNIVFSDKEENYLISTKKVLKVISDKKQAQTKERPLKLNSEPYNDTSQLGAWYLKWLAEKFGYIPGMIDGTYPITLKIRGAIKNLFQVNESWIENIFIPFIQEIDSKHSEQVINEFYNEWRLVPQEEKRNFKVFRAKGTDEENNQLLEIASMIYEDLKIEIKRSKGNFDIKVGITEQLIIFDVETVFHSNRIKDLEYKLMNLCYLEKSKQVTPHKEERTLNVMLENFDNILQEEQEKKAEITLFTPNVTVEKKDLVVIAARPGVGKTALAIDNILDQSNHYKIGFWSLEMSKLQVLKRMLQNVGEIYTSQLYPTDEGFIKAKEVLKEKINNIQVYEGIGISYIDIIEEIREEHKKHNFDIIYIDYIQLLKGLSGELEYTTITNISKNLKWLAMELNVCIIGVAQLNREGGKIGKPNMSQLKGSGQIEQDASLIVLLHKEAEKKAIEIIIEKSRHTATKTHIYDYMGEFYKFKEVVFSKPIKIRKSI